MIVRNLPITDYDMVRKDATHCLMESASNRVLRYLELSPSFGFSGVQILHGSLSEIQRCGGGISLEVSTGAVALDSIAPLGNLPLELHLWLGDSLR